MQPEAALVVEDGRRYVTWTHYCHRVGSRHTTELELGDRDFILVREDPLTIDPSVMCCGCGKRGWIICGTWV